jgi:hypothetical protein
MSLATFSGHETAQTSTVEDNETLCDAQITDVTDFDPAFDTIH